MGKLTIFILRAHSISHRMSHRSNKLNSSNVSHQQSQMMFNLLTRLSVLVVVTTVTGIIAALCVTSIAFDTDSSVAVGMTSVATQLDLLSNIMCLFLQFSFYDKLYFKLCGWCHKKLKTKFKTYAKDQSIMEMTNQN